MMAFSVIFQNKQGLPYIPISENNFQNFGMNENRLRMYSLLEQHIPLYDRGRQHSFAEIDHEIFSTVILSLPLIQEGQLSVSGERMCTILVNRLED